MSEQKDFLLYRGAVEDSAAMWRELALTLRECADLADKAAAATSVHASAPNPFRAHHIRDRTTQIEAAMKSMQMVDHLWMELDRAFQHEGFTARIFVKPNA